MFVESLAKASASPFWSVGKRKRSKVIPAIQQRLLLSPNVRGVTMASITVHNLDDDVKPGLRLRAAGNGRSIKNVPYLHFEVDRGFGATSRWVSR